MRKKAAKKSTKFYYAQKLEDAAKYYESVIEQMRTHHEQAINKLRVQFETEKIALKDSIKELHDDNQRLREAENNAYGVINDLCHNFEKTIESNKELSERGAHDLSTLISYLQELQMSREHVNKLASDIAREVARNGIVRSFTNFVMNPKTGYWERKNG